MLFLFLVLGAPNLGASERSLRPFVFTLPRMGTLFRIELYATGQDAASKAATAAFDRIEELEQMFSDYREDNELSQLSREGWKAPRAVTPEMIDLLGRSVELSRLSGGAFDITVGPVVALWREARRTKRLPDPDQLARARAAVDYKNLALDPANHTVFLKRSDMKLDLGAIAKGYAADEALAVLKSHGIGSALVQGGGDTAVGAPPPGQRGWRIAIDSPDVTNGAPPCTLVLHDVGIATSGDSQQFVEIGGTRYSHIVNPATGMALTVRGSSTVVAPDGAWADGLATALCVLPVGDGLRVIASVKGASAYLVRESSGAWHYYRSAGFPKACGRAHP